MTDVSPELPTPRSRRGPSAESVRLIPLVSDAPTEMPGPPSSLVSDGGDSSLHAVPIASRIAKRRPIACERPADAGRSQAGARHTSTRGSTEHPRWTAEVVSLPTLVLVLTALAQEPSAAP